MPVKSLAPKQVYLMASGDLRLSANQKCWPAQSKMEAVLTDSIKSEGWKVVRAHPYDPAKKHGCLDSQTMGLEIFRGLDPKAPVRVAGIGLAIQPSCPGRPVRTSRANPDRGQLERHLAGIGRDAEPQRFHDQGGHSLQHALERGFYRRVF